MNMVRFLPARFTGRVAGMTEESFEVCNLYAYVSYYVSMWFKKNSIELPSHEVPLLGRTIRIDAHGDAPNIHCRIKL